MNNDESSNTLEQDELYRLADIGCRKVYNISLNSLAESMAKAGKTVEKDLLVLLSMLGAVEEGSSSSSPSEEAPGS